MIHLVVTTIMALLAAGLAPVSDPVALPKGVPPVLGMAIIDEKPGVRDTWSIKLTLPRISWEIVGEMVPKQHWPELKTEITPGQLILRIGGPSQLVASRVVDLKGKELSPEQVAKRLSSEIPVLVSVSGQMPDAYYLQLTSTDALIIILGTRDGIPAVQWLPSKKHSAVPSASSGKK